MKRLLVVMVALALFLGLTPLARSASTWPVLNRGTRGVDVTALQHLLNGKGYSLNVDGHFDVVVEDAVKDWQRQKGLTADGVVGPATWPTLTPSLKRGDSGPAVNALQKQLKFKHGYDLTINGNFDAATESAVKKFENHLGWTADGTVGDPFWQNLISHFNQLGNSGYGFYHYLDDGNDDWGTGNTIGQVKHIAERVKDKGICPTIGIGDISLPHGGNMPPHSSHQDGIDADIRPLRDDCAQLPVYYTDGAYNRAKTDELIQTILNTGQVEVIFFNDPEMINKYAKVKYASGHDNHLHVRFER